MGLPNELEFPVCPPGNGMPDSPELFMEFSSEVAFQVCDLEINPRMELRGDKSRWYSFVSPPNELIFQHSSHRFQTIQKTISEFSCHSIRAVTLLLKEKKVPSTFSKSI